MPVKYWPAKELMPRVNKIIQQDFPDLEGEYIVLLWRDTPIKSNGRIELGKTAVVSGKPAALHFMNFPDVDLKEIDDNMQLFVIEICETTWLDLDDVQRERLLKHELMHCGLKYSDDSVSYYVVPHDVEDFKALIEEYGINFGYPPTLDENSGLENTSEFEQTTLF